jgi:hypothetical protein
MRAKDTRLTETTVNLTPRAVSAMHAAAQMLGDSQTDVVCIALMTYAQLVEMGQHDGVYRVVVPDIGDRPLYLRVSRAPFETPQKKRWWQR